MDGKITTTLRQWVKKILDQQIIHQRQEELRPHSSSIHQIEE